MTQHQVVKVAKPSPTQRLHHALGPIAGAMILDASDILTFGPLGIYAGALVGGCVGFWLTGLYRFSMPARLLWSAAAGIYCSIPFTEMLPIATLISACHRFAHAPGTNDHE